MAYEKLLAQNRIRPYSAKPREVPDLLSIADRDVTVAEHNLELDADWSYNIAYNAVLQASRALMLKEGFRSRGPERHVTAVRFAREALGKSLADDVDLFDQMRRKRHLAVYDVSGRIGEGEAQAAVAFARRYVENIRELIS